MTEPDEATERRVPRWLLTSSEVSWRVLVVLAAIGLVGFLLVQVRIVVIPLGLALLIAGILAPPAAWMKSRGVPPALASLLMMIAWLGITGLLLWFASARVAAQFSEIGPALQEGWDRTVEWVQSTPLSSIFGEGLSSLTDQLGGGEGVAGRLLSGASTALEIGAMAILTIVFTFFFLKDGDRLFAVFLRQLDRREARVAERAGETLWETTSGYFRGIAIIATINALLKGLALWLIGVPLIGVLMLITFLGSFVPFLGAVIASLAGALVALTGGGVVDALLVVLAGIVIQQIEGNLLEPLVMGRVMHVHPGAVVAAVAVGAAVAGLPGAFFAVPVLAVGTALYTELRSREAVVRPDE